MSDRVIDPTRQGVSHEPEPDAATGQAQPLSLEEACAIVDGWAEGFAPFRLHQVARALRRGLTDQAETIAYIGGDSWMARANAAEAMLAATDAEVDGLRDHIRGLQERRDLLVAERSDAREQIAELAAELLEHERRGVEDDARLGTLRRENQDLRYRLAQTGEAGNQEAYPLSRCLDLMDAWRPGVERWGLHQMCRVLREAYQEAAGAYIEESENADRLHDQVQRIGREAARLREVAKSAIPCAKDQAECGGPNAPYAPCCNLRAALLPGEPFPTDYLPNEGFIHLFEPGRGDMPRVSAGCVRLIEPIIDGWDMEADARRFDENIEAMLDDAERAISFFTEEGMWGDDLALPAGVGRGGRRPEGLQPHARLR